ncbi:MAG: Ig-like domain-containing protein [Verrucomicrobiales bacterium]|nr:Ig-like domain-containing protein [Verrucomicrobiales bacterium]
MKIEILQELTLEREAFEARMTINNGVAGTPIDNIKVDVHFEDDDGNTVEATSNPNAKGPLFFIRLQDGYSIPGSIAGGTSATIKWLIIPAPGAAGETAQGQWYYVGATLSYRAAGVDNEVVVDPDDILVKPMPALTLDYFLPDEVYGDDPFTEEFVEPPVPFSLGVRVKNSGIGAARKLKIDSAQPRIIENKLGLLVDFKLHGCEVNGEPAQPTLLADFGDIESNSSGVARWIMTSSLSGRFVEFTAYYTHADELGGQLTSLITDQPKTHFLVHDVLVDLPGRDGVRDFLAREDADDPELRVYESQNADILVMDQSEASSLVSDGGRLSIRTPPMNGFLFIRVVDPAAGRRVLRSAQRGDGKQLPGPNAWLSQTWDRDALKWDYFVNVFDVNNTTGADYILDYKDAPGRTNRPPSLDPLSNWAIGPEDHLSFPITATDLDGDRLGFELVPPAPVGASVTPEGEFSWQPGQVPVPSTNRMTVKVTDNGLPALSDSRGFTVVVRDPTASEPPVLLLSTNLLAYAEQNGPVLVDPLVEVTDEDTPVWDQGRLTVAVIEGGTAEDTLALAAPSESQTNLVLTAENVVEYQTVPVGTLGIVAGETNVLTVDFNSNATIEIVQEVVRAVTFENTAIRGESPQRVIQFNLDDGEGGVSAPVDLDVDIWPLNHAPLAEDDEAATTADVPIALLIPKLVGNDSDADDDELVFELLGNVTAQRGTVDIVGQAVVYVPNPNLVGTDSFTYRITDPYGGWAEARVNITVRAATTQVKTIVSVVPNPDGSVGVKLLGIPNRTYTVQWSFDLLYWSFLMKTTAGPTGMIEFTDQTADPSRRFYRIIYP